MCGTNTPAPPERRRPPRWAPAGSWGQPGRRGHGTAAAAAAAPARSGDEHAAPAALPAPSPVPARGSGTARSVRTARTARRRQRGECSESGQSAGRGPRAPQRRREPAGRAPEASQRRRREPSGTGMPKPPGRRKRWPLEGGSGGPRAALLPACGCGHAEQSRARPEEPRLRRRARGAGGVAQQRPLTAGSEGATSGPGAARPWRTDPTLGRAARLG